MEITVRDRGAFSWVLVHMLPGERFISEAGALFRASRNVDIDVTTRQRGSGGILGGLKRMLAGESFFLSTYSCTDGNPGEVGLAPKLQGNVALIECGGRNGWVCAGGSYIGSTSDIALNTQFQGFRGVFSGESLSFLEATGQGQLVVSAFGKISLIEVDGALTVDTGHVVAFEETLEYTVTKVGGSWLQSMMTSEGVVMNFKGRGRIYVQSHNPDQFGRQLGPLLPPRRS